MIISYLLLTLVVVTLSFLGILIFSKNYRTNTNQYFFLFIFTVIVWVLSNYFENAEISKNYSDILLKLDFSFAFLLSVFFYFFCVSFPEGKIDVIKKWVFYLTAIIFSILSFSNLIINHISFVDNIIDFQRGYLFIPYALGIFSFFTAGLVNLTQKYRKASTHVQRLQILYVLIGLFVSVFLASILNLILPQIFLLPLEISRIGIYSILVFCILTSYAILKHHLFNIKVIATEILTFAIWIILVIKLLLGQTWQDCIIDGGLLFFVIFFGILLIRSVIKEVSQREKLEIITKELEAANERLRQLDEAKSEFLSIASHQLRTPLTSIKGLLSMLLEGFWGPLNEEQQKYISQVSQSGDRLLHLVEDLLDISRIEAGRMTFDFQPVDMEKLTEDIIRELEPQAAAKKLSVNFTKPPQPFPKAKADSFKIRQVIQNLIDNSIKYTEEGGAEINLTQEGNEIVFSITDTGRGVASNQQAYLFGKFQRGEGAAVQHTEGVGLGLYLADKIIKEHHGKIWIESAGENQGSTFCFTLPIA